jgi:hypothetical protein
MKITSDLTNLTTAILILTVQMFIEWTLCIKINDTKKQLKLTTTDHIAPDNCQCESGKLLHLYHLKVKISMPTRTVLFDHIVKIPSVKNEIRIISAILFPNSYNIDRYIENWLL